MPIRPRGPWQAAGAAAASAYTLGTVRQASVAARWYYLCMHARPEALRASLCGTLFLLLGAATWPLHKRFAALLLAAGVGAGVWAGPAAAVAAPVLLGWGACSTIAYLDPETNPDINSGHRAGAEGYPSDPAQPCENTVQALAALAAADNGPNGPLATLQYVEIDVHETKDAQLVVLHDSHLTRAFPPHGNAEQFRALEARGLEPAAARVQDLTLEELQALNLGGRAGVRAPSLEEFMNACQAHGVRRGLVVEVKRLHSDAGRTRLLQLLRRYREGVVGGLAAAHPQRRSRAYGWLCVIAFPHAYAASFGALGSPPERFWARQLAALDVPAKCCCMHYSVYNGAFLGVSPRPGM